MEHFKKAIDKAIDGGYKKTYAFDGERPNFTVSVDGFVSFYLGDTKYPDLSWADVCMDRDFFQALGKAEGWEKVLGFPIEVIWHGEKDTIPNWQFQWHRFIDSIASGGEVDEFFNQLLKK